MKVKSRKQAKASKSSKKSVKKLQKDVKKSKESKVPKSAAAPKLLKKVTERFSKAQLLETLSEQTGVAKKQVGLIIETLGKIMGAHICKGSVEKFVLPGLFKVVVKNTPARKARKGINPFTGKETLFKAKPAGRKVRIVPLKQLKEMVR